VGATVGAPVPHEAPESEAWFDEYVRGHGHDPGDPEPDLGIEKNPDRLISWKGHEVVCEIKQFESHPFVQIVGKVGTLSLKQVLSPVRRKIGKAAEQLKPLAESGRPLVVVLANPKGMPVPFSSEEIIWALYGDPIIQLRINTITGAAAGPATHTVGRNSRLLRHHQYLSAVVALRRGSHQQDWHNACWERMKAEQSDFDPTNIDTIIKLAEAVEAAETAALANGEIEEGDYLFTEVFTATSETAVPLPRDVFDGPRDTRWDYDVETENYERTRGA
jgi:hypothetical protein